MKPLEDLKKILDRLTSLDSGVPYNDIHYYGFVKDAEKFHYLALMPEYKEISNLILNQISEKLSSIESKKYKIFNHINHLLTIEYGTEGSHTFDYSIIEEFYIPSEVEKMDYVSIVTELERKNWYKSLCKEIDQYYSLLEKYGIVTDHKSLISEKLAHFCSNFEIGTSGRFLKKDSTSSNDFVRLMTDPNLLPSEKKKLKIKFDSDNQLTSFVLKEFIDKGLIPFTLKEIENFGCFFFSSGSPFTAKNFNSYLSKFNKDLNNGSSKKFNLTEEIRKNIEDGKLKWE